MVLRSVRLCFLSVILLLLNVLGATAVHSLRGLNSLFVVPFFRARVPGFAISLDRPGISNDASVRIQNTVVPETCNNEKPIDRFLFLLNTTYPKYYPNYSREVVQFFATNSIHDLDISTLVYITKRMAFSESIHCGIDSHVIIINRLYNAVIDHPDLTVTDLSTFLHSLTKMRYHIPFIGVEKLVALLTVFIPYSDHDTVSFLLKNLQQLSVNSNIMRPDFISTVAEYLKKTQFSPQSALRLMTVLHLINLDRCKGFDLLTLINFLNNVDWSSSEEVSMEIVMKSLNGLREYGVKFHQLSVDAQKGLSAVFTKKLRLVRDSNLMLRLLKYVTFLIY